MIAAQSASLAFFRDLQRQQVDFDGERFLTEVDALFQSPDLLTEVRWRLEVLYELSDQRGMEAEFEVLRDRLTQIFAGGGEESAILERVRGITRIETQDGRPVDLRHFLKSQRRIYNESEYREALRKKIANTQMHVLNLSAYYPDEEVALRHLRKLMEGLAVKILDPAVRTRSVKTIEDNIRGMPSFRTYERLKDRFLRDWLGRFAGISNQQLAKLGPDEVQRLILEHQRHQTTQLVKAGVRPLQADISEHLGVHDTLEGEFTDEAFWAKANVAVRRGFAEWILRVVQAVGMVDGHRYAFFQSEADPNCHLLCGLGLARLPTPEDGPIRMVPYIKPFTRKAGYLLEVRRRHLGDPTTYYAELRHYTLPFMFGFDHVPALEVPKSLREFFNSQY
ncbi:MAG TPA: hypothetical protein VKB51_18470 [bacterium]|nr:hypothetical protein [bacterium]